MEAWERFLDTQRKEIGDQPVDKWLRSLKVVHFDACNLYLEAKDSFHAIWFEEHIRPKIQSRFVNSNHHAIKVHLSIFEQAPPSATKLAPRGRKKETAREAPPSLLLSPDPLDETATLQRFVSLESNSVPYRLACELTGFSLDKKREKPSLNLGTFNPIYIHGPSGSGKTHLLMAIAKEMSQKGLKVFFIHAERFTEHVVSAMRSGGMQEFRRAYRHVDLLLVDDVHLLARRTSTQEELFHTFNSLHTAGHQMILSSNCPPPLLTDIEPRLVSRFEWGIILHLTPSSSSELKHILLNRTEALRFPLQEEVLDFLIETFSQSAKSLHRALEALVLRFQREGSSLAPSSLLDAKEAEELLVDLIKEEKEGALSPHKIIRAVADFYGIRTDDILGDSQHHECSLPRKMAMYLCRSKLKIPFLKIGSLFSRDHSTVMTSVKQVQKKIESQDREISSSLAEILRRLDTAG